MADNTSADLSQQVQQLAELVQKQGKIIAQTGKQLMELQISGVKARMAQVDSSPQQKINVEDFATNEDIVQLVCELQGQLDFMEERSIARTFNSHLTKSSDSTQKLAPLCNRDGAPAPECFPKTVGDLHSIDAADLLRLSEFYELIIENEVDPEMEAIMKSDTLTAEDAQKIKNHSLQQAPLKQRIEQLTPQDVDELFDEFARFVGVRIRRGTEW
ncbi:hypothetical protein METBIDRAFT_11998 [Metschnikowia bicuspidata var. bicuspidata NRRL YB-4993]|uniref:Uncharacterized protein n=1 Tax=Metschnikowia bicuspidata var. bicuspidata NRRL YB-4993 TaxID=869754 RepID=A0A1A0HBV8_9ASCO|nr:hypothetical protein METBIDRAFT_11998 [Metschnikowia bicuspidata var. bicuspidata NRRL YB-4993]OBA21496.1 hypothetical protein METBIDRAFT_11998 [Metschnikowia bicuspidata var. bicuspidata NRRL YB-4993]